MTRARELARLGNTNVITTVGTDVGIGTLTPQAPLDVVGVVSATSFYGDLSGESVKVTDTTSSTSSSTGALIISGGVGIGKSLFVTEGISVGGTITYDDVTNIDSVGIVTAGKGLRVTTGGAVISAGNVKVNAGIASIGAGVTVSSDFIHLTDNSKVQLGIASDFEIYHNGSNSYIKNSTGGLILSSADGQLIQLIGGTNLSETLAKFTDNGSCEFYYDNSKKIETTSPGVLVAGICSATEFSGDGSQLSGVGGDTDITSCLFI